MKTLCCGIDLNRLALPLPMQRHSHVMNTWSITVKKRQVFKFVTAVKANAVHGYSLPFKVLENQEMRKPNNQLRSYRKSLCFVLFYFFGNVFWNFWNVSWEVLCWYGTCSVLGEDTAWAILYFQNLEPTRVFLYPQWGQDGGRCRKESYRQSILSGLRSALFFQLLPK